MSVRYDSYYQTANLFGEAAPELLQFFQDQKRGPVLDLGCGQGRDALALSKMGFEVTGVDHSEVGIHQMLAQAKSEGLPVQGVVADLYNYEALDRFDYILLDSMFHFQKKDRAREVELLRSICQKMRVGSILAICIQDQARKIETLLETVEGSRVMSGIHTRSYTYTYSEEDSHKTSDMNYQLLAFKKT